MHPNAYVRVRLMTCMWTASTRLPNGSGVGVGEGFGILVHFDGKLRRAFKWKRRCLKQASVGDGECVSNAAAISVNDLY
jgi:hypothetical protein